MKLIHLLWGSSASDSSAAQIGNLILRVFAGLSMAFAHGLPKFDQVEPFADKVAALGFPAEGFFAWAAILAEFVGGILLALGLGTRVAAFFMLITMLVAAFLSHGADPFSKQEKALLYAAVALYFVLTGGGRYAVDRWLRKA
jgi:putative oxidoreductase